MFDFLAALMFAMFVATAVVIAKNAYHDLFSYDWWKPRS